MIVWTHPSMVQPQLVRHVQELDTYVPILRPSYCRANQLIDSNQLYVSFLYVRHMRLISVKEELRLANFYEERISQITGSLGSIVDIKDVLRDTDMNTLLSGVFGRKETSIPAERLHSMIDDYLGILKDVRRGLYDARRTI